MNINIICDEIWNKSRTELNLCLIKLYPDKEKEINICVNSLSFFSDIYITNDVFTFKNRNYDILYLSLKYEHFIKYINLLSFLNEETFAIKIKNNSEYIFIIDYFKNNNYIIDDNTWKIYIKKYLTILIIDNEIHVITDDIQYEIFNDVKLIDANTFIRTIKLKQLL